MIDQSKHIYVYADWEELKAPARMGCLHSQLARGKEIFSFEFDSAWLKTRSALTLDPDLQMYSGRQYADSDKHSFGLFLDSAPDRWGRQLIRRREAIQARHENRPVRQLLESDYLLGVHDITRMGALRFTLEESGDFLDRDFELAAPPWTSLRELEAACRHYEDESPSDTKHEKWLNMLLAPGSSLGGARPKANVLDTAGNLWIAKFPSRADNSIKQSMNSNSIENVAVNTNGTNASVNFAENSYDSPQPQNQPMKLPQRHETYHKRLQSNNVQRLSRNAPVFSTKWRKHPAPDGRAGKLPLRTAAGL